MGVRISSDSEHWFEHTPFDTAHPVVRNYRKTGRMQGQRKKSSTRVFDTHRPDKVGGEHRWRCLYHSRSAPYRNKPGFVSYRKTGTPCGMTKHTIKLAWERAKAISEWRYKELAKTRATGNSRLRARAFKALLAVAECDATLPNVKVLAAKAILDAAPEIPKESKPIKADFRVIEQNPTVSWLQQIASEAERQDA